MRILFVQVCFQFLLLSITANEDYHIDRRASALEHISGGRELEQCQGVGSKNCWFDWDCCGQLECLGVVNWTCGNDPGKVNEECDMSYKCEHHLLCHNGRCKKYEDVLLRDHGKFNNQCITASSPGQLKIMTYNVFLIMCAPHNFNIKQIKYPCQAPHHQIERIGRMMNWMKNRNEDVVMVQELFQLRDTVIRGMRNAGFCHYVSTPFEMTGSGLAIFSKHPIEKVGFLDWQDGLQLNVEAVADKGVMYAKINNGGTISHVFNTHTQSDSMNDDHPLRMQQFSVIKDFVRTHSIPSNELILLGGDMNENMFAKGGKALYYKQMLEELEATDLSVPFGQQYSFDTKANTFVKSFHRHETYQERLDFIMASHDGRRVAPCDARCSILRAVYPAGNNLSDHYPVTCTIKSGNSNEQDGYVRVKQSKPALPSYVPNMKIIVHLAGIGDKRFELGMWAGTEGEKRRMETFEIADTGNIQLEYMAHIQSQGDTNWQSNGFPGRKGMSRRMEGFAIRLRGGSERYYSVKYAAHIEDHGDTHFVYDGEFCGFRGKGKRIEAIFVQIVPKCGGFK